MKFISSFPIEPKIKKNSTIQSFYDPYYFSFYDLSPYVRQTVFHNYLTDNSFTKTQNQLNTKNHSQLNILKAYVNPPSVKTSTFTLGVSIGPKLETNMPINKFYFKHNLFTKIKKVYNKPNIHIFQIYRFFYNDLKSIDDSFSSVYVQDT